MVVGALAGLVCLGSAIAVFVAARSETGKKIFSAIDQGVKLAEQGVNAPGAAQVRAAGCPQSTVMDMKEAMKIAEAFLDGGLSDDPELDYTLVSCSGPIGSTLPTCEAVATAYAKAVHSERSFAVEVKISGHQKADCYQQFSGDGTFVKAMK
jgi:hypothetical protein